MRWSRRSGSAFMILIVSTRVNRRDFRTESCRWTSMQTVAPFYPKCAISRSMKSQGRSVLQYNAKQDLILISKKQNWYSCNLDVFCDKGIAILQSLPFFWPLNSQFGLFWPLFCIVWLFIEIFIRCQAKFLTCYCFSVISLLRTKK